MKKERRWKIMKENNVESVWWQAKQTAVEFENGDAVFTNASSVVGIYKSFESL